MTQDKTGLLVAALVAIVAIVGLVVLLQGGSTGAVIRGNLGVDFLSEELDGSSEHCYFVGVNECPTGVACTNPSTGLAWCQ